MADTTAALRMITLKMIVMGESPTAYRVAVVPENITFTQLAWILEEMLELPKTDMFEFAFKDKQEKIREKFLDTESEEGEREDTTVLNSDNLYTGDWMEHEGKFVFRLLNTKGRPDREAPRYRIEIKKREDADETKYSAPLITDVRRPRECTYWTQEEDEINATLREKYALKRTDTPLYPSLAQLKEEAEGKDGGIYWCTRPLCRVSRQSMSIVSTAQSLADIFTQLVEENVDLLSSGDIPLDPYARLTKGQSAAMEKLQASVQEKMDRFKKELEEQKNMVTDLSYREVESTEAYLAGYNRKDLEKIASQYDISTSGLDEKELAHEITAVVLDPEHMKKVFMQFHDEALVRFEQFADRRIFSPTREEERELLPFVSENYVFSISDGFFLIPEDVAAAYKKLLASGYRAWREKAAWAMDCEACFSDIIAAGPEDVLYEMFLRNEKMREVDRQAFWELLSEAPEEYKTCVRRDGYVYAKWTQSQGKEHDIDAARFILSEQAKRDVPYYIPTAEEIVHYSEKDYPFWEPSYQALKKFYLEDMGLTEYEAEKLLIRERQCAGSGAYMKAFMETPEASDLVFTSPEQLDRFIQLYSDAHVHTRMCVMKGHTPEEMGTLLKDDGKQTVLELQNMSFNVSFDPSTVKAGPIPLYPTGKKQKKDTAAGQGEGAVAEAEKGAKKRRKSHGKNAK